MKKKDSKEIDWKSKITEKVAKGQDVPFSYIDKMVKANKKKSDKMLAEARGLYKQATAQKAEILEKLNDCIYAVKRF